MKDQESRTRPISLFRSLPLSQAGPESGSRLAGRSPKPMVELSPCVTKNKAAEPRPSYVCLLTETVCPTPTNHNFLALFRNLVSADASEGDNPFAFARRTNTEWLL